MTIHVSESYCPVNARSLLEENLAAVGTSLRQSIALRLSRLLVAIVSRTLGRLYHQ